MTTLITGATGYTGRPLVEESDAAGVKVRAVTRDPSPYLPRDVETVADPGAHWAPNARAADTGTLARGRKSRPVKIRSVLREFPVQVPVGVRFAKSSGMVIDGTPDEFDSLAGRLAIFRFEPG